MNRTIERICPTLRFFWCFFLCLQSEITHEKISSNDSIQAEDSSKKQTMNDQIMDINVNNTVESSSSPQTGFEQPKRDGGKAKRMKGPEKSSETHNGMDR